MRTTTSDDHSNDLTFTGTYEDSHEQAAAILHRIAQAPKPLRPGRDVIINHRGQHCGYEGAKHRYPYEDD